MKISPLLLLTPVLLIGPSACGDPQSEDPAAYSRELILPLVEKEGKDRTLFAAYKHGKKSTWNKQFWGASLGFDQFTGIGWGTERAGVLVTPEHVISAAHYGNKVGKGVHFYDEDGKFLGARAIAVNAEKKPMIRKALPDVRIARLASPAPKGARIYAFPDPETHDLRSSWSDLPKDELPILLATDWRDPIPKTDPTDPEEKQRWTQTRYVHPVRLMRYRGNSLSWSYGRNGDPAVHSSYHGIVNVGDSSHPIFWVTKSGLVLASTFTSTGSGPNYGSPELQTKIQEAIDSLGGEKKYKIKTVPVP